MIYPFETLSVTSSLFVVCCVVVEGEHLRRRRSRGDVNLRAICFLNFYSSYGVYIVPGQKNFLVLCGLFCVVGFFWSEVKKS